MKKILYKRKFKSVLRIMLGGILGFVLLLCIATVFIFHNYVSKMHLANAGERKNLAIETSSTEELPSTGEREDESEDLVLGNDQKVEAYDSATITENDNASEIKSFQITENNSQESNASENTKSTATVEKELQWSSEMDVNALEALITKNLEEGQEIIEDKQVQNILLIGSDSRNSEDLGRSDAMILISINDEKKTIVATSFLRDIYLQIPGVGYNRLNAAYAFGGAELLVDTMELNFKIKIDQYVMVDFYTLIDIIDTIGGISVKIEKEEIDSINRVIMQENELLKEKDKIHYIEKAGTYELDGQQALEFSRNRASKNGDFDRTSRQRRVIESILMKLKKQNVIELNNLLNLILPQVTTDFTEGGILMQLLCVPSYIDYKQEQWSIPMEGTYSNCTIHGKAVLSVDFEKNINELRHWLYADEGIYMED